MTIAITNGKYRYGAFNLAIDVALAPGTFTAVLGPSGAGKSTLLNLIAGFEYLTSGKISFGATDMTSTPPAKRPVSMIFQDNNTFAHLDARTNVALGISPQLDLTDADEKRIDEALERTGLAHLAKRKPGDMSGGERQRIALARAIVRNRPVLLLDEAFAALGPALRNDMLDLVEELHKEKHLTTLMVTHNPEDAKRIADQVIFVNAGIVHPPVPVPKFFLSLQNPEIADYLGEDKDMRRT